jgi:phosphoglycerate dehydrogenase-like enzyme
MTKTLRIVLPGGAATGAEWVRARVADADIVVVDDADLDELKRTLEDADAVVAGQLEPEVLRHASELRLVHVLGAGWDGIAVDALPPGCVVCNVYEHETAIGEWVLMVMLALTRRLIVYDRDLRAGEWHTAFSYGGTPERDLRGRVVGCIGVGNIGSRVVELARAFGMRTIAITRAPTPERTALLGVDWLGSMADLNRLLEESDFVVVCAPLTETTVGLLGAAELALIGPSGYLINVARGAIVQETPLYEALRTNRIAGAGLDVWYRYPEHVGQAAMPANSPFWELENVVMTPHSAGWSENALERRWRFISEQIARLDEGRALKNVVARR